MLQDIEASLIRVTVWLSSELLKQFPLLKNASRLAIIKILSCFDFIWLLVILQWLLQYPNWQDDII